MKRQTKVEITAETVKAVIEGQQPTSMAQLARGLGYKGNVSGSLAAKLRSLCPDLDALLAKAAEAAGTKDGGKAKGRSAAPTPPEAPHPKKAHKHGKTKPASAKAEGKYPRDPRNSFRAGSAYGICFDILATHKQGLPKKELVRLLAEATDKDEKLAGYDAQVLLSAKPNETGLNNNDSPRHRACRPGFYVKRDGDNVTLAVD